MSGKWKGAEFLDSDCRLQVAKPDGVMLKKFRPQLPVEGEVLDQTNLRKQVGSCGVVCSG